LVDIVRRGQLDRQTESDALEKALGNDADKAAETIKRDLEFPIVPDDVS
jgi:hypothetical protein